MLTVASMVVLDQIAVLTVVKASTAVLMELTTKIAVKMAEKVRFQLFYFENLMD